MAKKLEANGLPKSPLDTLEDPFSGMTEDESVTHQVTCWEDGNPLHNTVRDECCPDFSCCNGGNMMSKDARTRLLEAHIDGDEETVQQICMMGLSVLVSDIDVQVHIAGEGTTQPS